MKIYLCGLAVAMLGMTAPVQAQEKAENSKKTDTEMISDTVEVSCGQCNFKMDGKGCNTAVRIDGKTYWVDKAKIDDHGDAHGKDGFCSAIRHAYVEGKVVKDKFKASKFVLLPVEKH